MLNERNKRFVHSFTNVKFGVPSLNTPALVRGCPGIAARSSSTALQVHNPIHAIAAVTPGISFLQFLLAFVSGGLFFSTAIAAVTASYAIGKENVKRALDILRIVSRSIWVSFTLALGAAKSTLRQDGSWKWRNAWKVLRERLGETRRTAVEGVKAIRQEVNMYAAAVGAPGLIILQYVIDHLLQYSIAESLEQSLKESLQTIKNRNVKRLALSSFSIGKRTPKLEAARVYDLGNDAMAFDCDVSWDSELEANINLYTVGGLARLPIQVKNIRANGVVRIILAPLTKSAPGFGAALVSLPSIPNIGLDIRVAGGDITRIPWLRAELMSAIQKGIADELLWPRRVVIPSEQSTAKGKPILSKREIEELSSNDPMLRAEKIREEQPMLRDRIEKPDVKSLRKATKLFFNTKLISDENQIEESHQESSMSIKHAVIEENSMERTSRIQNGVLWSSLIRK